MDWLRRLYIRWFEMDVRLAFAIWFAAGIWAFLSAWWMQEQGWP